MPAPVWKVDYTSAATKFATENCRGSVCRTPYRALAMPRPGGQTLWKGISGSTVMQESCTWAVSCAQLRETLGTQATNCYADYSMESKNYARSLGSEPDAAAPNRDPRVQFPTRGSGSDRRSHGMCSRRQTRHMPPLRLAPFRAPARSRVAVAELGVVDMALLRSRWNEDKTTQPRRCRGLSATPSRRAPGESDRVQFQLCR